MTARETQEMQADERLAEVVGEAQDVRARVNKALDRLEQELRNTRKEVDAALGPPAKRPTWRWPWAASLFLLD